MFLLLTIRPEDDAAAGEYASVLEASGLPASALRQHRLDSEPLGDALEGVEGVIVGGSPYNATDELKPPAQLRAEDDLARLTRLARDNDLPTMFTCYGIGVAAAALGGTVEHGVGEPVGPANIELTPDGERDPLLVGLPSRFEAFVGHKESVTQLPADAVLLASSPHCHVEMFRVGTALYATQFHPEPTANDLIARARIYQHHGYFPVHELAVVEERIGASRVSVPRRMLRRFVEHFSG
ncbi:glutamine amidotransferase [Rathayibacter sp. YIM 133350]|uniref:glutamine amidotransferase n=1 Tax=Rathayibacter sp. YIM 133350 TaxID=3131992 RepID=UPI00307F3146